VAACGPAMMELEAIDEAPLPPRPRTADLTLPPIATKAEARRALDAKEVEIAVSGLVSNVRTLVTRAKARTGAELTVLRTAVKRACRDVGDKSLAEEAEKLQVAWAEILADEDAKAAEGRAGDMSSAQQHLEAKCAGVEELEGRMRKAQWRTRKIESEKMAVAFKRKTLRTDLKELFDNRVKFLEEHTEKLRVELEAIDAEIAAEEDRRTQLRDTVGMKAENHCMELAKQEMMLANVVAHVKELMLRIAELEDEIEFMIEEVKAATKDLNNVEDEFTNLNSLAGKITREAERKILQSDKDAERQREQNEKELANDKARHEAAVAEYEDGAEVAAKAKADAEVAQKEAEEALAIASKKHAETQEKLKAFEDDFAKMKEREDELAAVKQEVLNLREECAEAYKARMILEKERDKLVKMKGAFEKRRSAIPSTAQERCAWRSDWLRSLRATKMKLQGQVRMLDKRSQQYREEIEETRRQHQKNLEERYARHYVHMMSAIASQSLVELLQPGTFDRLEADAAEYMAAADERRNTAVEEATANAELAEADAHKRVRKAEAYRSDKVAALTKKVEGTIGAATAAMSEKKRELELRLIEWNQQKNGFLHEIQKHDAVGRELAKRNSDIEKDNLELGSQVAVAKVVQQEAVLEAQKARIALEDKETMWVKRLSGLRDRLEREKQDLERDMGKEINALKDNLGSVPSQLANAERRVRMAEQELADERATQKSQQDVYDATFREYTSLQEQLIRSDGHTRLIHQLGDADATLLELATRTLQKEFLQQEQELRDMLEK